MYLRTYHFLHPCYHPKIIGHILKHKPKNKFVCFHEIIRIICHMENRDGNEIQIT